MRNCATSILWDILPRTSLTTENGARSPSALKRHRVFPNWWFAPEKDNMHRKCKRPYRFLRGRIQLIIFIVSGLLTAVSVSAIQEPEQKVVTDVVAVENADGLPGFRIGVRVDLVSLHASVLDKEGHFVPGLDRGRFRILEDGVEQKIESFTQEDVPMSMGVVLDLSGTMLGRIEQVNRAAMAFIHAGNPDDEFFLIGFNDEVELLQDYTSDHDELQDALENTVVAGKTYLYDAIYLGVEKAHKGTKPKRAIVVVTDGDDDTSFYQFKELIAKIRESDVQVFCIGIMDEIPKKNIWGKWSNTRAKRNYDALVSIAEETGGSAFFPQDIAKIHEIVAEIARDLRSQYSFGYLSSNPNRDGTFRQVKIELTDKKSDKKIRHRRGYFAPEQ